MAINLTTPQTLTNGTRLAITRKRWDEDAQVITFEASMRTAAGGTPPDAIVAALGAEIRGPSASDPAGFATVIARGTPAAGSPLSALLIYNPARTVSQAQFDAALTALKANAATFEAHLLSAGFLHSSLAGT